MARKYKDINFLDNNDLHFPASKYCTLLILLFLRCHDAKKLDNIVIAHNIYAIYSKVFYEPGVQSDLFFFQ